MSTGKNRFSSLVQVKAQSQASEEPVVETPIVTEVREPEISQPPAVKVAPVEKKVAEKPAVINMAPQRAKKKGNPDYTQVTSYLKKDTHDNTKIALLRSRDDRDFSELLEDLLTQWLASKTQQA